jgi:hypothetical protein
VKIQIGLNIYVDGRAIGKLFIQGVKMQIGFNVYMDGRVILT